MALILLQLGLLLFTLSLSAFFSSAEVALFSMNPLQLRRLQEKHPIAADRVHDLLNPPTRLLSTILIGNTLVNVVISVLGFALALQVFPEHGEWIAIVTITLVLLVVGEIAPKRVAFIWPEKLALVYAAPLVFLMRVLQPLRTGLEQTTEQFRHLFEPRGKALSDEEFETVVDMSGERGVLEVGERDMVKAVLRLEDLQARDVMTPRVDLIAYDLNDDRVEVSSVARQAGVRQLVLCRGGLDQVEGFLDVRRFLLDPQRRVQAARLPPIFVPEAAPLDQLLGRFLREHRRAAIVVDEYGGTAGIVTRGDILEEITGDIDDEHADHRHLFEEVGPGRWLIDGQISLEEINEKLGLDLRAEGVDRLAGWLAARLEHLPRPGDVVTTDTCRALVQRMRRHRVTLVLLEKRVIEAVAE